MDASSLASRINATKPLKAGSLRFWGEWFGKPYDNYHRIVGCSATGDTLRLDFDEGETLTVLKPIELEASATAFAIHLASNVRWEWFYYGRPKTPANLYFYEFVNRGSTIEARTNVDWYSPNLSPSIHEKAVEVL